MDMQIFIQYPKTIYIKSNGPRIKMLENSATSSKKAILENYAIKKKAKYSISGTLLAFMKNPAQQTFPPLPAFKKPAILYRQSQESFLRELPLGPSL